MGVIRKRGKVWYIDYYLNGKRHVRAIGKSKRIAELALKDIEVRIAKKKAGLPIEHRISDWREQFIAYIEAQLRPRTVERYKESLAWFFQFRERLADPPFYLSDITSQMIEDFKIERLRQGRKKKTVNNDLAVVRRFLNLAVQRGHLHQNPMDKVEMLKLTDRRLPRFLTNEELERIYRELGKEDRDIVRVLANTGMRWGELRHLEWRDVDLDQRVIRIRRKRLHTGKHWEPKAGTERNIPINDTVYSILSKRKKTKGFVFTTRTGNILHRDNVRIRLQRVCERLGIENVNLHTLRHTFCSHLVMSGVDLPTVAKLAGHRDIKTTMIYSHLAKDHIKKAMERISL